MFSGWRECIQPARHFPYVGRDRTERQKSLSVVVGATHSSEIRAALQWETNDCWPAACGLPLCPAQEQGIQSQARIFLCCRGWLCGQQKECCCKTGENSCLSFLCVGRKKLVSLKMCDHSINVSNICEQWLNKAASTECKGLCCDIINQLHCQHVTKYVSVKLVTQ